MKNKIIPLLFFIATLILLWPSCESFFMKSETQNINQILEQKSQLPAHNNSDYDDNDSEDEEILDSYDDDESYSISSFIDLHFNRFLR